MKGKKYPFLIADTDRSDKPGTHWWSILDIDGKKDFLLFDSFGIKSLKNFIVKDDEKIPKNVLKGVENLNEDKTEIKLVNVNFSINSYNKLSKMKKILYQKQPMTFYTSWNLLFSMKIKNVYTYGC